MKTIFIDENIPYLTKAVEKTALVFNFAGRNLTNTQLIEKECDVLIVRSVTKVNEELLRNTKVRTVGTATIGTDHLDIDYLNKNNIEYFFAPGSNSNSVAEYVIFSILHWGTNNNIELKDKTIGIVGYGNIGKRVSYFANQLGLNVIINDPPLKNSNYKFPNVYRYAELDELISQADIITNHVPLTQIGNYPTKKLINTENIKLAREGSLFIHTSRGGVVDEESLIEVQKRKNITAVIDVWEGEPDFNTELSESAMISTPHIAGYSMNGKIKGALMMATNITEHCKISVDLSFANEIESHSGTKESGITYSELIDKITEKRDIISDNIRFKTLIGLDKLLKMKGFDEQRKYYPEKYEYLSDPINNIVIV